MTTEKCSSCCSYFHILARVQPVISFTIPFHVSELNLVNFFDWTLSMYFWKCVIQTSKIKAHDMLVFTKLFLLRNHGLIYWNKYKSIYSLSQEYYKINNIECLITNRLKLFKNHAVKHINMNLPLYRKNIVWYY